MEIKKIKSGILKELTGTTKDLINMGIWFLYETRYEKFPNAKYFLSADKKYYLLACDGSVIASLSDYPVDLEYNTRIIFSDMPKLEPVRNFSRLWA